MRVLKWKLYLMILSWRKWCYFFLGFEIFSLLIMTNYLSQVLLLRMLPTLATAYLNYLFLILYLTTPYLNEILHIPKFPRAYDLCYHSKYWVQAYRSLMTTLVTYSSIKICFYYSNPQTQKLLPNLFVFPFSSSGLIGFFLGHNSPYLAMGMTYVGRGHWLYLLQ